MEPFWSLGQLINCLSISRLLKQPSKVSVRYPSQEYLFGNFSVNKGSVAEFIFSKIPCFQHILPNAFTEMRLKYENYYLRCMEILDIQTTLTLQKPLCKYFWWNCNKNKSYKPYLGNKEQKWLFLVVSLSDVHIDFDF